MLLLLFKITASLNELLRIKYVCVSAPFPNINKSKIRQRESPVFLMAAHFLMGNAFGGNLPTDGEGKARFRCIDPHRGLVAQPPGKQTPILSAPTHTHTHIHSANTRKIMQTRRQAGNPAGTTGKWRPIRRDTAPGAIMRISEQNKAGENKIMCVMPCKLELSGCKNGCGYTRDW